MVYIEDNIRMQRRQQDTSDAASRDAKDEFELSERWKTEKRAADEGSVTNSMAMLTAIPEVDLGMECVVPFLSADGFSIFISVVARDFGTSRRRKRRNVKWPKSARSAKR